MGQVLPYLAIAAVAGTLVVLVIGLGGMLRGTPDPARANRMMRWRVALQALAVALLVLFLILNK
jgi:hypothetical protein